MTEKLQKVLARLGYGSRREMERWISDGRVQVNGKLATLGMRVGARDNLTVDGQTIAVADAKQSIEVILYHKPIGEICSHHDETGEGSVFDSLSPPSQGRWISVGRLDVNTSGLLLLTNNGDLAHKLMHPSSGLTREYSCRILGEATAQTLQKLTKGVELEDGFARFEHIVDGNGKGVNHWYYVVVSGGRNRLVRRLWESEGHAVNRLKRVRFGPIILGSTPKAGEFRSLTPAEMKQLESVEG